VTDPKPEVRIDIDAEGTPCLAALSNLTHLRPEASFHEVIDSRHPLGIYNVSINRLSDKVRKCCEKLEAYWKASTSLTDLQSHHVPLRREVIDYLELSVYAAAEHVDDAKAVARCFFRTEQAFAKSPATRRLKTDLKVARDRISAFANLIKHRQSRIRIFTVEFVHNSVPLCLHALFAEEFSQGAVRPSPLLHADRQQLISVTGFLWDIVLFQIAASSALARFLHTMSAVKDYSDTAVPSSQMADTILALARLPLYSFDEIHPFARTRVVLGVAAALSPRLNSGLYGTFAWRWTKSTDGRIGQFAGEYEGDGATRTFKIVMPQNLNLQHWD
jgi:hypothetical protein